MDRPTDLHHHRSRIELGLAAGFSWALFVGGLLLNWQLIRPVRELAVLGPYNIYFSDVLTIIGGVACVFGIRRIKWSRVYGFQILSWVFIVSLGFVSNFARQGLESSVVQFRYWLLATVVIVFVSVFHRSSFKNISFTWPVLLTSSLAAAIVMVGRIYPAILNEQAAKAPFLGGGSFYADRTLAVDSAVLMAVAVLLVATRYRRDWFAPILIPFFSAAIVLSNIRTAWIALIFALGIGILHGCRRRRFDFGIMGLSIGLLVAASLVLFGLGQDRNGGDATGSSLSSTGAAVQDTGSATWRLEQWGDITEGMLLDLPEAIVGSVAVSNPRFNDPSPPSLCCLTSAHNMFFDTWLAFGILGPLLLISILASTYRMRRRRIGSVSGSFWVVIVCGMAYMWPVWGWYVIGAGAGVAIRDRYRG